MRVLSRRRNFAKAIACGYYEGAGFACSNGTPLAPSPRSSPWRRIHLSDGVRGPPLGVYSGVPGAGVRWLCPLALSCQTQQRPSALRRCPGGDDSSTASASCVRGAGPCTRLCPHSSSARHAPPYQQQQRHAATASGAGRRLLSTTKASAPPRRRRLPPPCGFSHRGRGKWGPTAGTTRRHKHCSTAAATTAGVAHRSLRCTRERERCTEL